MFLDEFDPFGGTTTTTEAVMKIKNICFLKKSFKTVKLKL